MAQNSNADIFTLRAVSNFLRAVGRSREALVFTQRAARLNPLDSFDSWQMGSTLNLEKWLKKA